MSRNCTGARSAVRRCESAVKDLRTKISQNEEFLVTHPHDAGVQARLRQLRAQYETAKGELDNAEAALAECEAQNEQEH